MLASFFSSLGGSKKPTDDDCIVDAKFEVIEPAPRERDHIPAELNRATYREHPRRLTVEYVIFHGNRCVFSTLIGGSSINIGEDIAQVIARREKRDLESLRFYDLQTHTGYGNNCTHHERGDFEFDEIILEPCELRKVRIGNWRMTHCPDYVIALFKHLIGETPAQLLKDGAQTDF